jgi:acetyl-CoA carboxylase, biotin carboxylase subunit
VNAGTIEFLVDKYSNFYFMEMNTRIQVEHPITEMISSVDIVKEQIKIANKEKISFSQDDVEIKGHAIECRINAENPSKGFAPSPGKIEFLNLPGGNGIRVDTAVYPGYSIPPTYDSMIAKLIAYGKTREEAVNKMIRALDEFVIEGIDSNIEFQIDILNNEKFRLGNYDTSFISKEYNL